MVIIYRTALTLAPEQWSRTNLNHLVATDFSGGGGNPGFSASGSIMKFGIIVRLGSNSASSRAIGGIDNFRVVVNPDPAEIEVVYVDSVTSVEMPIPDGNTTPSSLLGTDFGNNDADENQFNFDLTGIALDNAGVTGIHMADLRDILRTDLNGANLTTVVDPPSNVASVGIFVTLNFIYWTTMDKIRRSNRSTPNQVVDVQLATRSES